MTKKKISLSYKVLTVISLLIGIILNIRKTNSIISLLSYYTLQSNIICLVVFISYIFLELRKKRYEKSDVYYLIKGAIVITIIITALIYRIALAPNGFQMDSFHKSLNNKIVADFLVHTFSPLLVLFDYVLFDEKGKFKKYYPFVWLLLPFNYVVYVYTYSFLGGKFYSIGGSRKYAYFFLDYDVLGFMGVAKWIIIISIFILFISYLLVCFDYLMGKKKRQK